MIQPLVVTLEAFKLGGFFKVGVDLICNLQYLFHEALTRDAAHLNYKQFCFTSSNRAILQSLLGFVSSKEEESLAYKGAKTLQWLCSSPL